MSNEHEARTRMIAFAVPVDLASAAQAGAAKDLTSVSYVCRRALQKDLKERGMLPETETAA